MLDGLLSGIFGEMTPEKRQGLLAAAAAMMQSRGGMGQAAGAGLQHGLLGYQTARGLTDRRAEEAQQREMRQMQIDQAKQAQASQAGMRQAFQGAMSNPNPTNFQGGPMLDDQGGSIPQAPAQLDREAFIRNAAPHMDPAQAMAMMQPPGPLKVGKDDRLVDPRTLKEVLGAQPNLPTGMVAGANGPEYMPAYLKGQQDIRAAGKPQVNVNTNMPPLEKREQGDKGALNIKNFGEFQGQAASARKENAILSAMEKNPVDTSRAAPLTATAAAWLSSAGLGGDRVKQVAGNSQMFQAAAMELVLQKQLAQKGPQTESDAKRLEQTVASLGNTKEANSAIIAFSKAANNKTISQERFYNDWWKKHKTLEGADEAWMNGPGSVSVWEDPALQKATNGGWSATRR